MNTLIKELNSEIDLTNYKNDILNKIKTAGSNYSFVPGYDIKTLNDLHKLVNDSAYFIFNQLLVPPTTAKVVSKNLQNEANKAISEIHFLGYDLPKLILRFLKDFGEYSDRILRNLSENNRISFYNIFTDFYQTNIISEENFNKELPKKQDIVDMVDVLYNMDYIIISGSQFSAPGTKNYEFFDKTKVHLTQSGLNYLSYLDYLNNLKY